MPTRLKEDIKVLAIQREFEIPGSFCYGLDVKIEIPGIDSLEGLSDAEKVVLTLSARELALAFLKGRVVTPEQIIGISETGAGLKEERPLIVAPEVSPPADVPPLPQEAPAIWDKATGLKPSEFLIATYGVWLEAGVLFRPKLREYDRKLMMALENEYRGRTDKLKELLPTVSVKAMNQKFAAAAAAVGHYVDAPNRPNERQIVVRQLRRKATSLQDFAAE